MKRKEKARMRERERERDTFDGYDDLNCGGLGETNE